MGHKGHTKTNSTTTLRTTLTLCATALFLLALAAPAQATKEHTYDPLLSLRGDCSVSALDEIPDPGLCPGTAGVDHPPKKFDVPCGPATDPHGDIYVSSAAINGAGTAGRIDVFNPKGEYLTEILDKNQPCSIAVDSKGNLYVAEYAGKNTVLYKPKAYPPAKGTGYEPQVTIHDSKGEVCPSSWSVAVDPSNDHLFIQEGCSAVELDSAANGNAVIKEDIGANEERGGTFHGRGTGVAVNGVNHNIYLSAEGQNGKPAVYLLGGPKYDSVKCEIPDLDSVNIGLAVDQANGDVYVDEVADHEAVYQYDFECNFIGQVKHSFTIGPTVVNDAGIAVDSPMSGQVGYDSPNKGEVYVAEGENSATFHLYAFAPVAEPETKEFLLTITKPGSGEGTVTSSPAGIVCGSECSAKFEEGKEVTLTASPAAGSTFTGWSGAGCSGTASCKVTMSEAKSVAAEFTEEESAPAFHTLTVTVSGEGEVSAGSGTITGCTSSAGPSCEGEYEEGASVVLTETPGAGSHFNGWQTLQCDESTASSCEVTIGSDDEGVAASFAPTAPEFPLAVEVEGSGTVTSEPGLISCNPLCSDEFEAGATVTLFATPAPGHTLLAWKGCGNVKGARCEVTMSSAKTVKASFTATPSLTVTKAGSGSGKVIAKGISCDANCSATAAVLKAGTAITLKATPSKGSEAAVFEGGTGNAGACTGGSCAFTLSEDSSVVVRFDPIPTKEITVNLTGPAAYKGKVKGKASVKGLTSSAINCGSGCTSTTEAFLSTSEIELSATAGLGYTFAGWSVEGEAGTCEGTTSPCALKTDAGKTLSAGFK